MANATKGRIRGVLLARLNLTVLDSYLIKFDLMAPGLSPEQKVVALADKMDKSPANHKADCSECGGVCDIEQCEVCPFCGAGEEGEAPAVEPEPEPVRTRSATKSTATKHHETRIVEIPPEETEVIDTKANNKPKPASLVVLEKELDENVALIQNLKRAAVGSYWKLGQAILANYEGRLYTLRHKNDGTPKYKSWNQFVAHELGMSITHSFALMDVALCFSENDVATVGVAKLALVAKLSPSDREEVLQRVRDQNVPLSQVREEVHRLAGGNRTPPTRTGSTGFRGGRAAIESGVATRAANRAEKQITVAMVLGKKTLKLMRTDAPDKPATQLTQMPYVEEQMFNGVIARYTIVRTEEGLGLMIDRRREQDKAAKAPKEKKGKPGRPAKTKPAKAAKDKTAKEKPAKGNKKPTDGRGAHLN